MKIELSGEELHINLESDQEQRDFEQWGVEVYRLMPNLAEVWQTELQTLTDLRGLHEMMQLGARFFTIKYFFKTGLGKAIIFDTRSLEKKGGRPLDARTIQASIKLLLFAPYKMILEQEKAWRTKKYLAEVRDKGVTKSIKQAKYRASQDADMCVARAQRLVVEFLKRHRELVVPHTILCNLARDWENAQRAI